MVQMKDSGVEWIGVIPSNWEIKKVKHLFFNKKSIPGIFSKKYQRLALTLSGVVIRNKDDSEGLQPKDFDNYQLINEGNLVFKLIDLQNISTSRVGLSHYTGLVSPAYIILQKLKTSFVNVQFAEYFFLMMWYRAIFNSLGDDGVRSSLNVGDLLNIPICIPSSQVQNQIADFLDKKCAEIDSLSEEIQKEIDLLEEYKKSVITEAVTKGLNPDVEMKDSGVEWIGEIPNEWTTTRLKFLLENTMKYGAAETGVEYSEDLPRYIRITDITTDNKLKENGKLSLTRAQALGYLLEKETILFARSGGTVGKTFFYRPQYGEAAFAGYLISATPNKSIVNPKWIYYFTLSNAYWDWVNRVFTQATIQNIGADRYSNMQISLPKALSEQNKISDFLDKKCTEIDKIISEKHDQLTILSDYKKSLIYEYVTGKKEVI